MAKLPTSAEQAAEERFGQQLADRGLSPSAIPKMSLAEVNEALAWVNKTIEAPEPYGSMVFVANAGTPQETLEAVDIAYPLYPRRSLLLTRQRDLLLEQLAAQVAGDTQAAEAVRELISNNQVQASSASEAETVRVNAEHRTRLLQSWWTRESVASIVGACLLGVFGLSIAAGMWLHTDPPQLLSNAFLLVLGYFFGQSTERRGDQKKDGEG